MELSKLWNLYQIVLHLLTHFNYTHVTFRHDIYQTSSTIWKSSNKKPIKGKDPEGQREGHLQSLHSEENPTQMIYLQHTICLEYCVPTDICAFLNFIFATLQDVLSPFPKEVPEV